ncbi:macrophage colony-stimulating factor 1 receptor 2 isoform X1 [Nothobranchius furzeri]|uniref:receptor protein-tyrosine kinase n=3 Tax=Nothobranchius furzeri TaxID=105023 RepID=A0A1A7ZJQ7_NOTFU
MRLHSLLLSLALCCCFAAEPPGPPALSLNSEFQPNQTEVVLMAGSSFQLSCHGNGTAHWSSTAFLVRFLKKQDSLKVMKAEPRHTGTYRCSYANQSLEHLNTWIHLYITDPADPSSVFVTPRRIPSLKEGDNFLFMCLLTDPSVTNVTLQPQDRNSGLPPGMNVTFDPQKGVLIHHLRTSYEGRYHCSGWRDGQEFRSKPVDLLVLPKLRHPPTLYISQADFIRLEGELFDVTCQASNPSHFVNISWTHPHIQDVNVTATRLYDNKHLFINSTLTVLSVTQRHTGLYTCTAVNEAGVSVVRAHLRVLDHAYLRICSYLQTGDTLQDTNSSCMPLEDWKTVAFNSSSSLREKGHLIASVSTNTTQVRSIGSANISGYSKVEVYEGEDVTLTFVMEAYPPIRRQHWRTPTHMNNNTTVFQESFSTNGCRSKASLLLRRVRHQDRGQYSFYFSNWFFNGSQDVDLRIYRSPTAAVSQQNESLTCSSSGHPPPTVYWLTCTSMDRCENTSTHQVSHTSMTSQEGVEEVKMHLPLSADEDVIFVCVAYNLVGEIREVFVHRSARVSTVFTPALIGALSAAAILFLLLLVVFYRCRQKPKFEIRWKIIESTDGNNYTFVDPTQLLYNQKWEFPRDKLRLGAVLGSGAFGKVVEATAYGLGTEDKATRVAVKMLKPRAHSEERDALMSEMKILSHLGYHDNIVNLLGACTQGGPMLMITEYCSHGDLLNFLRAHAQDFMVSMMSVEEDDACYKNIAVQPPRLRSDSGISCWSDYQEVKPALSPGHTDPGQLIDTLSVFDLMRFSYQVAEGLDFLSSRNCIHRDVAARNVLLTDRHVAKICDFGLARDIRNDDSYIVQGNALLPVKWMAPESIFECVYTVQSDVWSYGVLLWEIFSLGKSPYPNVVVDTNFYKMIKDGRHMEQPEFAPDEMYHLMTLCWSLEPTNRPTFKMIGQLISRLLPSTNDMLQHPNDQVMYKNIDECREDEEVRGASLKRREEERDHRDDAEEMKLKNIYQLS